MQTQTADWSDISKPNDLERMEGFFTLLPPLWGNQPSSSNTTRRKFKVKDATSTFVALLYKESRKKRITLSNVVPPFLFLRFVFCAFFFLRCFSWRFHWKFFFLSSATGVCFFRWIAGVSAKHRIFHLEWTLFLSIHLFRFFCSFHKWHPSSNRWCSVLRESRWVFPCWTGRSFKRTQSWSDPKKPYVQKSPKQLHLHAKAKRAAHCSPQPAPPQEVVSAT